MILDDELKQLKFIVNWTYGQNKKLDLRKHYSKIKVIKSKILKTKNRRRKIIKILNLSDKI